MAVQIVVVALFALTCGALAAAWMRGRLGAAAIALFVVALVVWVAAFAAIATEFHDASALAVLAPPLLNALAALAMLVTRGSRWRARRAAAHDNRA